jgi:hypothetical protein
MKNSGGLSQIVLDIQRENLILLASESGTQSKSGYWPPPLSRNRDAYYRFDIHTKNRESLGIKCPGAILILAALGCVLWSF